MADNETFADFVAVRSPRLLRTAFLLTRDWALAEDLLQTALVKAWSVWRRIGADPEPYVRAIIVNTYASWWRRRWRNEHPTDAVPDTVVQADRTGDVDERDRVWEALGRLPRKQRVVLVLRFFEDLSDAQIAETLGISVGTPRGR